MLALVLALVLGYAIGRATGPDSAPAAATAGGHTHAAPGADVGGLAVSAGGYTLVPSTTRFRAGVAAPFEFRVLGPDGKPLTTFVTMHDKPLHLVVARRDLTGYQHLHPTMAADGTWSVALTLPAAGSWRAFADFVAPGGVATTLGVDLAVPGDFAPVDLPPPSNTSTVDGLAVSYEGAPRLGNTSPLLFRVDHGALEPYLGAYGHLVVVREGDLAYLHVHPDGGLVDGAIRCWLPAPSVGRYRAFLDFQVDGAVHTAQFTLVVS